MIEDTIINYLKTKSTILNAFGSPASSCRIYMGALPPSVTDYTVPCAVVYQAADPELDYLIRVRQPQISIAVSSKTYQGAINFGDVIEQELYRFKGVMGVYKIESISIQTRTVLQMENKFVRIVDYLVTYQEN